MFGALFLHYRMTMAVIWYLWKYKLSSVFETPSTVGKILWNTVPFDIKHHHLCAIETPLVLYKSIPFYLWSATSLWASRSYLTHSIFLVVWWFLRFNISSRRLKNDIWSWIRVSAFLTYVSILCPARCL